MSKKSAVAGAAIGIVTGVLTGGLGLLGVLTSTVAGAAAEKAVRDAEKPKDDDNDD